MSDSLGVSVSIFGDAAVVGAPGTDRGFANTGSVYVYRLSNGLWVEEAELIASDAGQSWELGRAVSIHGNRILAGAAQAAGVTGSTGAAYMFEYQAGSWVETQKIIASDGAVNDRFGDSASLHGNYAVIGAPEACISNIQTGSAYVFVDGPGGWSLDQKLAPSELESNDSFGFSVSVFGAQMVIGAYRDDDLGSDTGAAYLFENTGSSWQPGQKLLPTHSAPRNFGYSVDLAQNLLAVGSTSGADGGVAYVFEKSGSSWIQAAELMPSGVGSIDSFGGIVSVDRRRIAVGASGADFPTTNAGSVFVFDRDLSGWTYSGRVAAPDFAASDYLGTALSVSEDRVLAGVPNDDDLGLSSGSAYIFDCIDCNRNGLDDGDDLAHGTSVDCNDNQIPDECEIAYGTSRDCNANGIPDECDVPGTAYCFCDSAAPCGNTDDDAGCRNVTGSGAFLDSCGTSSVGADDLTLTATNLPATTSGLFFMGGGQDRLPFGDGQRCVTGGGVGTYRFPVQNGGATGSITLGPGIAALSHIRFGVNGQIAPGQTWNFQLWHRDPLGPCGNGFNTSSAYEVTFRP